MKNKYIITWDIGFGENAEIVEAKDKKEARKIAYDRWRDDAENEANYNAKDYSEELADIMDLL